MDGPKPLASRIPVAESNVVGSVWDKDTGAPVHGLEPKLYAPPGTRLGLKELTSLNVIVPYELTGLMVVICASTEPATSKAHVMENFSKAFFMVGSPAFLFFAISKPVLEFHTPTVF